MGLQFKNSNTHKAAESFNKSWSNVVNQVAHLPAKSGVLEEKHAQKFKDTSSGLTMQGC
jgi:hypothetical protein